MKVINLWAGPGAGKSTTAAGLFRELKLRGQERVELVMEYAKELVYAGDSATLSDQHALLREQDWRLRRLLNEVDYVISDSPLALCCIYAKGAFDNNVFRRKVMTLFNSYENVNIFLRRVKPYQTYGRTQTRDEALEVDKAVENFLFRYVMPTAPIIDGDENAHARIVAHMQEKGLL